MSVDRVVRVSDDVDRRKMLNLKRNSSHGKRRKNARSLWLAGGRVAIGEPHRAYDSIRLKSARRSEPWAPVLARSRRAAIFAFCQLSLVVAVSLQFFFFFKKKKKKKI